MKIIRNALVASTALVCINAASAQDSQTSWWSSALSAVNETTPAGLLAPGERHSGLGWFGDITRGSGSIYDSGKTDLMLTAYTYHAPYAYPNRHDENALPFGAGVVRRIVDSKDNEHMLYAMVFSDSHYDPEPFAGYGWVARWPIAGTSLKGGLGYSAFLTARSDTKWIPVPGLTPLASIGNDTFTIYAAWLPFIDVGFVFARMSFDDKVLSPPPMLAGAPRVERNNLVYAAAARVKVDGNGVDGVSSNSANAPLIGLRHFFTPEYAVEITGSRERHNLDFPGLRLGTFEREAVALTGQYHFPLSQKARLYAGLGVEYQRLRDQQLPTASLSTSGVSPAVQGGATYSFDGGVTLNAGLTVSYPRNALTRDGLPDGHFKLSPTVFSIGAGYAF